jgi:hypothetical protein
MNKMSKILKKIKFPNNKYISAIIISNKTFNILNKNFIEILNDEGYEFLFKDDFESIRFLLTDNGLESTDVIEIISDLDDNVKNDPKIIKFYWTYNLNDNFNNNFNNNFNSTDTILDKESIIKRFNIFKDILIKNKNNIDLPKNLDYPIDIDNLNKWNNIFGSKNQCFKAFSNSFVESLKYIDYKTFINKIKNSAIETINIINNLNNNIYVGLFIPNAINKSNFWTSLLFFRELLILKKDLIIDIIDETFSKYIDAGLIITIDDANYSGQQLTGSLLNFNNNVNILNATPYITTDALNYMKENLKERCIFIQSTTILTDFTSVYESYLSFINFNRVKLLPFLTSKPRSSFTDCIRTIDKNLLTDQQITDLIGFGRYPIYFAHKIADQVSTFDNILKYGIYLDNNGNIKKLGSLIKNCCPNSYYKTINYILPSNANDDLPISQFFN